jgi:uncharacterized LabA/DUF88 family protein
MNKPKRQVVYVFIDSQNLNLGTSKTIRNSKGKVVYHGWTLDYKKFHRFLIDKYRANKVILFIGYIEEYKDLYKRLKSYGYELVFKPTTKDGQGKPKGNVDAEIVLHAAAVEAKNFDKAIVVSGDGDFRCLYEYLETKGKLLKVIIPNKRNASSLLKKFENYKVFLEREKEKLEYRKYKWET